MQLHELQPKIAKKDRKRVGRGGKRGAYSGKGMKGQKARSGSGMRSDFRGGDTPLWKLFPKQRGANKKTGIKHRMFKVKQEKPLILNLDALNKIFSDGDAVSREILVEKGLLKNLRTKVKVLSDGKLEKNLTFSGLNFSSSALKKIKDSGSTINE